MDTPLNRDGLPKRKLAQIPANKRQPRLSDLRRLSHELINCLTVVNLSCFKIRGIPAVDRDPGILDQLETIEKTVAEAAELLVKLPEEDGTDAKISPSRRRVRGKVYPLFKPIRGER